MLLLLFCHVCALVSIHPPSTPPHTHTTLPTSVAWVKSQSRMASTSNQETFKAEGLSGRVVYDVLRQVCMFVCV